MRVLPYGADVQVLQPPPALALHLRAVRVLAPASDRQAGTHQVEGTLMLTNEPNCSEHNPQHECTPLTPASETIIQLSYLINAYHKGNPRAEEILATMDEGWGTQGDCVGCLIKAETTRLDAYLEVGEW